MELNQNISQKQIISNKTIQSINILQLNNIELTQYINDVSLENPVIVVEPTDNAPDDFEKAIKKLEWLDSTDEQNRLHYKDDYEQKERFENWGLSYDSGNLLSENLKEQLHALHLPKETLFTCDYIIDNLNEDGYLEDYEQLIELLEIPEEEFNVSLQIVQSLEPVGIGARNLCECLTIQLVKMNISDPYIYRIIKNDIDALGKKYLKALVRKYEVTEKEIVHALEIIKGLNPKPGRLFSCGSCIHYIIPDVMVLRANDGFEVILSNYDMPMVNLNSYYVKMMRNTNDSILKDYIGNKINQANWIKTCIYRRNSTLLDTVNVIVEKQHNFFKKGQGFLCPLKLSDVAEVLGLHESTISRAIKNKYLQCSFGVFQLKYFFVNKIETNNLDADSNSDTIKNMLKEIIAYENKANPLSDQKLTENLNSVGIRIKRRTIGKYREELGIPIASARKEL